MREQADRHLGDSNVFHHELSLDAYVKQQWSAKESRVDLVISSILPDCKTELLKMLPSFCDKVLKPGGYAFFIVTEDQYTLLHGEFGSLKFKLMEHSFKILYKVSSFQKRCVNDFPQRNSDIAIVARKQGIHPRGFQPAFVSQSASSSQRTNAFSSILDMNACQDKLKKPSENAALCNSEKSVEVFQHIITLFTPSNGAVLDPMAGALTAGIASLHTGRKCILLEKNPGLYKFAVGRLRIFATPQATMKSLGEYSGPIDVDALETEDLLTTDNHSKKKQEDYIEKEDNNPTPKRLCVRANGDTSSDTTKPIGDREALGAEALLMFNQSTKSSE